MKIDRKLSIILLTLTAAGIQPAQAERADRDKPIQLEARRITVDDAQKTQILEGDVMLSQGTLSIRSEKIVITEDKFGFQKGVASGGKNGLARFRQKREGKDEYIDGEAERIEYSTRNEVAELFRRAWVKSGQDEVKGDYIRYDALNEKYMVTSDEGDRDPKAPPSRVRAIIQPKSKNAPPPETSSGPSLDLKGAGSLGEKPGRE